MDKIAAQGEFLFNRLKKRYRHLKKWARRTGTNAFRLYDRDIPEIPLVLDLYGDAVSGSLYKQPLKKKETALQSDDEASQRAEIWLAAMKSSIYQALGINESHIFLKERRIMKNRQSQGIQYSKISAKSFYRDAREGGLLFRVNLSDYIDTGLFLDARKKRAIIRSEAAGKRVLNLFAYTCSLSVCAAKGGARQVDSVDLSKTYLDWGKVNFALNGIEAGNRHNFIESDVSRFLGQAGKEAKRWDIIILDPPSFSNSKKTATILDIQRDYIDLIRECLSLLSPGGTLWFSSSAKGIKIQTSDFPGLEIKDMGKALMDEDFRGKRMPACYALKSL
jgi:23S rRNA G2069 N7-methylase RlmK/C1962 C5-methylase RlmI